MKMLIVEYLFSNDKEKISNKIKQTYDGYLEFRKDKGMLLRLFKKQNMVLKYIKTTYIKVL